MLERKLAAILAADVVGYSRLMAANEAETLSRLQSMLREVIEPKIHEFGGRVVKLMGDGLLADFSSTVNAVKCAAEFQQAISKGEQSRHQEQRICFRVGINLGDIIIDGDDIFGDGVNVAARLEALAQPNGVCLSGTAYDTVDGKVDFKFEDLGTREVKNIAKPVRTYRLVLDRFNKAPEATSSTSGPRTDKPSIAVLPFANMSGDAEQEYFADGLTEDVITELARFRSLAVIARSSSFTYKGLAINVADIGQQLGVNYLVEGSVRKAGNRVRVTAQLIEVGTNTHLWADRYDRSLEDIFAVQDELVTSIVGNLGLSLNDVVTTKAKGQPTESLSAYEYLLRARSAWWHGRIKESFEFALRSVEADPNFASAQAYLALQHAYQSFGGTQGLTKDEIAERAQFHAEAALELDDADPFVHASASMAFGFSPKPNKDRGFKHINVAVSLNPHDWELMFLRAWQLSFMGRQQEALDVLDRFHALNPLGGYMVSECLADTYYMMGEYKAALQTYKEQMDAPPQALPVFAACHAQLGDMEAAKACLALLERTRPEGFNIKSFAEAQIAVCAQPEDQEKWRTGFRLAGVDV